MKFEDYHFHDKVKRGLAQLGFKRPTDIQFKSIPTILNGEDLFAIAQTGTGKTAAFVIPIVDKIYRKKHLQRGKPPVQCLVLVPTHELGNQVNEVFKLIGKHTSVTSLALIGGVDQDPQIDALERGVDVVVATPGRMFDMFNQGHLDISQIHTFVLDEADYMLDLGFIQDIKDLMHRLPNNRQTLFFSATVNLEIKKIAYHIVHQNAIRIQLSPKDPVSKNVTHYVMYVEMDHKRFFLERVVNENPEAKVLVFVRTKVRAERVAKAMGRAGLSALTIHGDKDQSDRSQILNAFKTGECNLLIATDLTARGIDIPDIQIVINYDLPAEAENYVHRVGRTGRGKNKGHAYSFCSEGEKPTLKIIESFMQTKITELQIDRTEYSDTLNIEKDRANDISAMLRELEGIENKKSGKSKRRKK